MSNSADPLKKRPREQLSVWVIVLPYLIGLMALFLVPLVLCLAVALTDFDAIRPPNWVGPANFERMARDPDFWNGARASLFFLLLALPLRAAAVLLLAWLLQPNSRSTSTARAAVYLPSAVPDVAYAFIWLFIFNPLYGPLNWLMVLFTGPIDSPLVEFGEFGGWLLHPTSAQVGVVLMLFWVLGEGFVLVLAAVRDVPSEQLEMAALAGAGPWTRFQTVTVPRIAPFFWLMLIRDTAWSLQASFVAAVVVTRGGPYYATSYLPYWIYLNATDYQRLGYAAAMTLGMLVLTVGAILLQLAIARTVTPRA